jgi:hypothetical protein
MTYHWPAHAKTWRGSFLNTSAKTSLKTSVQGVVIDHKRPNDHWHLQQPWVRRKYVQRIQDVYPLTSTMGGGFRLR